MSFSAVTRIPIGTLVLKKTTGIRGVVAPGKDSAITVMGLSEAGHANLWFSGSPSAFKNDFEILPQEKRQGRVLILADMEGISRVPNEEAAYTPAEETGGVRTTAYAAACKAMTLDVQLAITGVRAAGIQDIVVADCHWYDSNLEDADFDVPVVRGSQAAIREMATADAVILVGFHAKAGTPEACQPHTYSERIANLRIDGEEVGEIGMLTKLAASQAAPVVLVTGDYAAHLEAQRDVRNVKTVVTKFVNKIGIASYRPEGDVWCDIISKAYTCIKFLNGTRSEYRFPGDFEVEVRPGFEVEPDLEAREVLPRVYRLSAGSVHATYTAFQRFVDRLPALGAAPLARKE